MDREYSITELCKLADITARTIRFYIQSGVLPRPIGEKKGARYTHAHLEQLLQIRKWQAAGLCLERIRELLVDPEANTAPPRPRWPGMVEVWSHLHVSDGLEIHIEPGRARLSPEQLRSFMKSVMAAYEEINKENKV